jgi:hypothetical protein
MPHFKSARIDPDGIVANQNTPIQRDDGVSRTASKQHPCRGRVQAARQI